MQNLENKKDYYDLIEHLKTTMTNPIIPQIDSSNNNVLNLTDTIESSDLSIYYKKTWTKLNNIHKILKIKEFVNNLSLNSLKKNELIILLTNLVKNKTITKKNMVEYDEEHCKILSIDNLEITKNDYNYKKNENVII